MDQPFTHTTPAIQAPEIDERKLPYKIYVGFDKDRFGNINHIDIIDGYLKANEQLEFKTQYILENSITCIELQIVPAPKMNTYLQIKPDCTVLSTVLVKVFQFGKCKGYQWVDLSGNILISPKNLAFTEDFYLNKL